MRTTQTGASSARPASRPTRPLSASRHGAINGNTAGGGGHERSAPFAHADTPVYKPLRYLGRGSFGVVLLAEDAESGEKVAIKRVRYDPRLRNREVAILNSVLVDPKPVRAAEVPSQGEEETRGGSPSPQVEAQTTVQEWAGTHHPNIVELRDSYITYDTAASDADAAFHAQMNGREGDYLAQMHQPRYPMAGGGGAGVAGGGGVGGPAAGAAYAYLEMVMSYLPMDLHAVKKHFYRHHAMPTAERSPSSSSFFTAAAVKKTDEEADTVEEKSAAAPRSATPPHAASPPGSPKTGLYMPLRWVKIYLFQLARALAFMHAHHVCHRDLKPANVLVDPDTGRVQVCDFGSAKQILRPSEEKNVSYICSRYYRAPELLFGALHYGCEVDMWSFGCLLAELLRESGRPLFRGCTSVDQMAELFKVMGAPSRREMYAMNPHCAEALLRTHAMRRPGSMAGTGYGMQGNDDDDEDERVEGLHPHPATDGGAFLGEEEEDERDALGGGRRRGPAPASAHPLRSGSGRRRVDDDVDEHASADLHHDHFHSSGHNHHHHGVDNTLLDDSDGDPMAFGEYYDVLKVHAIPWKMLFPVNTSNEALALVTGLLCYVPQKRLSALEVVEHAFFNDLFAPAAVDAADPTKTGSGDGEEKKEDDSVLRMPNGRLMPLEMFQLTATERELFTDAFQAKMARQADLIAAALKRQTTDG